MQNFPPYPTTTKKEMTVKQIWLTLAIFCIAINANATEIEIGKTYTETELSAFTNLVPFIEATIANRSLSFL
ncbi:MAG: hypothetical protein Ta2A_27450 [Treponemataceae bacterium]|nr:MAG: hypothetical protein Ta2A_27450 [Treponemataceae bacterium]